MIDHAAAAFGQRHDGAHTVNIGSEAAEYRQAALADQLGCFGDSF